jgi:hypothetical protein
MQDGVNNGGYKAHFCQHRRYFIPMPGTSSINEEYPMTLVRFELLREGADGGGSEPDNAGQEK